MAERGYLAKVARYPLKILTPVNGDYTIAILTFF